MWNIGIYGLAEIVRGNWTGMITFDLRVRSCKSVFRQTASCYVTNIKFRGWTKVWCD